MRIGGILQRMLATVIALPLSVAVALGATVNMEVNFRGEVDCQSPTELDGVPLTLKGQLTLDSDRTAIGVLTMTAYYILQFKTRLQGTLGAPPELVDPSVPGVTAQIKVVEPNGLMVIIGLPNNDFIVRAQLQEGRGNPRCIAQLENRIKPGNSLYNIYAGDTMYFCDRFDMPRASCTVH